MADRFVSIRIERSAQRIERVQSLAREQGMQAAPDEGNALCPGVGRQGRRPLRQGAIEIVDQG